jgi:hypothetical protein
MRGVDLGAKQEIPLRIQDPSHCTIIDWHADERSKDLGEEDGAWRNVHIVAELLVLQ